MPHAGQNDFDDMESGFVALSNIGKIDHLKPNKSDQQAAIRDRDDKWQLDHRGNYLVSQLSRMILSY